MKDNIDNKILAGILNYLESLDFVKDKNAKIKLIKFVEKSVMDASEKEIKELLISMLTIHLLKEFLLPIEDFNNLFKKLN